MQRVLGVVPSALRTLGNYDFEHSGDAMNGLLGLYCYSASAKRSVVLDAVPGDAPESATDVKSALRASDSWWNLLRPRVLKTAAHA
jgi:hypothetical protein